jgi:Xaa-Pro aminopeptidase/Xaa-Pro dipeptidase
MRLTTGERDRRHIAIRQFLDAEECVAYLAFDGLNFVYATNFLLDVDTWERPVAAVIPRDGEPFAIMNELSINHHLLAVERGSCWVSDARFYVEHPRVSNRTYTRPEWDRMVAELLSQQGLGRGRIAVDSLGPISPALRAYLPDVTFVAKPEVIQDLRLIKSAEEQAIIRFGAIYTLFGIEQYRALIEPGAYIAEVSAEVRRRIIRRLAEEHPDEAFSVEVEADSGVDTACPHSPGGNIGRVVKVGDSVITNVIISTNGYVTEDERTFIVGDPTNEQVLYMEAMTSAQQAAIDAMIEGNIVADIDSAAQRVHEEAGTSGYLFHRTGHGIGLGGHEYPDDTAFNYRPLQAGMVFSAEPAIFVLGLGGFRHSDTVIVGEEEPEQVTRYSKRLEDLVIPD